MAKFDEGEYKKRIAREIAEEAAKEKAERDLVDRQVDDDLMFETFDLLGIGPSDMAKFQKEAEDALGERIDVDDAMRAIKKGKKLHRQGKKAEAKALLKKNKNVRKISKAQQKKKGCAVLTLVGLALTVYGAVLTAQWGYELVALVLR